MEGRAAQACPAIKGGGLMGRLDGVAARQVAVRPLSDEAAASVRPNTISASRSPLGSPVAVALCGLVPA